MKIFEVDLVSASGNTPVFTDPAGTDVDLKQLSDNQGAKFLFLNNTVVPFGTYTGVRVVLSENFTVVVASTGQTLNKQFSPAVLDGNGHAILTYTFTTPVTVTSAGATIAIDFNLSNWVEVNGSVDASIGQGSTVNLGDTSRQVTSRTVGIVQNLTSSSFSLKHGNHNLKVAMGPATVVTGGVLKNNSHVFVYAVWSQSTKTLLASKILVH